jgi:hypothetical protein
MTKINPPSSDQQQQHDHIVDRSKVRRNPETIQNARKRAATTTTPITAIIIIIF